MFRNYCIPDGGAMYFANCTSDPGLCREQGVTGFPTLHAFRNLGWIDGDECFTKHTTNKIKYIRRDYHGVLRVKNIKYFHYRPPTKLREGNVFRHVHLFTWGGGRFLHTGPRSHTYPFPDILKLVQFRPHYTGTTQNMFKLIHYQAQTVEQRVVGIQLKSFLVIY